MHTGVSLVCHCGGAVTETQPLPHTVSVKTALHLDLKINKFLPHYYDIASTVIFLFLLHSLVF